MYPEILRIQLRPVVLIQEVEGTNACEQVRVRCEALEGAPVKQRYRCHRLYRAARWPAGVTI